MSPNVSLIILFVAAFAIGLLGCIVVANVCESGPAFIFGWILSIFLAGLVLMAGTDLHACATGKAHYELRDNPDGTRTWQRVEVTK